MASSLWKCLSLLVVLLLFIAPVAAKPKVLKMELNKRVETIHTHVEERQYSNVAIGNSLAAYFVNVSVGTPPQVIQLQVDTGSSDVWMFGANSCDTRTSSCRGPSCKCFWREIWQVSCLFKSKLLLIQLKFASRPFDVVILLLSRERRL
jgi:hypothetical protein